MDEIHSPIPVILLDKRFEMAEYNGAEVMNLSGKRFCSLGTIDISYKLLSDALFTSPSIGNVSGLGDARLSSEGQKE